MLKNPSCGWCRFEIGSFIGSPSYLEDAPVNTLTAFISYYKNGCGSAWYDEEGSSFTLVLTPYSVYVIEEKDGPVLYDFSDDVSVDDLTQEVIADIESCVDDWAMFTTDYDDVDEIKKHRGEIVEKLNLLMRLMRKKEIAMVKFWRNDFRYIKRIDSFGDEPFRYIFTVRGESENYLINKYNLNARNITITVEYKSDKDIYIRVLQDGKTKIIQLNSDDIVDLCPVLEPEISADMKNWNEWLIESECYSKDSRWD